MTQPNGNDEDRPSGPYDLELHLAGVRGDTPNGQIRLADLAAIAGALQELNTRIARLVSDREGPGRTTKYTSQVAELRLSGIRGGSTKLDVGFGSGPVALPDEEGVLTNLVDETAERFWQIIDGIATGLRPPWTTPLVADSALGVLSALKGAADGVVVTRADSRRVAILTFKISRDPWSNSPVDIVSDTITVSGILFRVDIESKDFRIRDDVGNAITLEDVQNIDVAAGLVGSRTSATGIAVRNAKGDLRVRAAFVAAAVLPAEWRQSSFGEAEGELARLLRRAASDSGPDPEGIAGLSMSDVDDLLAALNG